MGEMVGVRRERGKRDARELDVQLLCWTMLSSIWEFVLPIVKNGRKWWLWG